MSRRRSLSSDESALWQRVARSTRRLQPAPDPGADTRTGPVPDPSAPPVGRTRNKSAKPVPEPALPAPTPPPPLSPLAFDLAESVSEALARTPVRMDRNAHARMIRGKLVPEARIDLHGMTLAEAHPALTGFILGAQARGLRLVLVITGKGRTRPQDDVGPMPRRAGVLKHEVPHWLRSGVLRPIVLEIRESHRSHGGTGAYYVYLRKRR
ncbi:MAG: Smr/MutS family protein [Pararhodobacter sp.]|nr:Smr/MutS family protein [Pararhodobacter sp.]